MIRRIGVWVALLTAGVASGLFAQAPAAPGTVYRVPVTGVIEHGLAPFVERSIQEAAEAGAVAVVLDIDTPGGRVDAAQRITDAISDAPLPVYAYVNRRALSAGAMISLATRKVYMRPGSTLGAATPVTGEGEKAPEKIVSAMRSEFRALAEARGLDPKVAEAMVDESVEIPGVVASGQLLTLSTEEATRLGFAEEVQDWDALLERIDAPGAVAVDARINWAERVVRFLTHPVVAPFLLSLGFLGLLIELKTPAFGLAGLAGAASLAAFFGSHFLLGLAGWEVALLLGLGLILLLVELLVIPGFGVAGILGILAILGGVVMATLGQLPTTGDIVIALNVLAASAVIVGLVGWQFLRSLPKDRRTRRLFLQDSTSREAGYLSSTARAELVGLEGVAVTGLRPAGSARFGEETIDVVSESSFIPAGAPVQVVRSEGYRTVVRPLPSA